MAKNTKKIAKNEPELPLIDGRNWTGSYEDTFHQFDVANYEAVKEQIESKIHERMKGYFVALDQGKSYVVREKFKRSRNENGGYSAIPELVFTNNVKELADFYANKPVYIPYPKQGKKETYIEWEEENFVHYWFRRMDRPSYEEIVFEPYAYNEEPYENVVLREDGVHIYNRFKGFAVEPIFNPEKCRKILDHLQYVIAGGDTHKYAWLLSWFAYKVQRPSKIGTTPVFTGPQGCGKGTVATKVMGRIIGRESFVQLGNVQAIIGRFSALRDTTLLTFLDEAIFSKNPAEAARLKSLITEEELTIEHKHKDAKTLRSHSDYIIATNAIFASPIEATNRRFVTFECKREYIGSDSKKYFNELYEEIEGDGVAAFFGFLLDWDLEENTHELNGELVTIDPKSVIQTASDFIQAEIAAQPHEEWWLNCLKEESLGFIHMDERDETTLDWSQAVEYKHIPKAVFFNCYLNYRKQNRPHEKPISRAELYAYLNIICPSLVNGKKPTYNEGHFFGRITKGTRQICVDIPDIAQARRDFTDHTKAKYDWETGQPIGAAEASDTGVPVEVAEREESVANKPVIVSSKTQYDDEIPF